MKESYIHMISNPDMNNPILIGGLPGIGDIGRIVAQLFIDSSESSLFAEMYSPAFPDYVFVNRDGTCHPPKYEFYAAKMGRRDFIVLTGDALPQLNDIPALHEICGKILDFILELGCKFIVTVDGVPAPHARGEIYVASTSRDLTLNMVSKGALIYSGNIIGVPGLLLGIAKYRSLKGICLLSPTSGQTVDREAAIRIYSFLMDSLDLEEEDL